MSYKKAALFLNFVALFAMFFSFLGCANQQPPHGGPKDVTPPRLLKATPPNMTRNFSAKVIYLQFDEYFKLSNEYTEITMSPAQDKPPEYKVKTKTLIITFKDTLSKNTTYVINFGKAIQDITEGNILKDFTYVFSTGPHIDSLSISGKVTNSITQVREKDATVMLFPIDKDSLYFGKKRPIIFTTTDTAGNFSINNLHDGVYKIYALKETTTPNKIYDNDNELIGFLKKPIHLYTDTSDIQLVLFKQDPQKFKPIVTFNPDGSLFFVFNKPLNNPSIKIVYPPALDEQKLVAFNKTNDTAYLYSKNMDFDSIRLAIFENGKPLDSISKMKGRKEAFKKDYTFTVNISGGMYLKPKTDLVIICSSPIDSYDASQITLTEDSTTVPNLTIIPDSTNQKRLIVKYHWKQDSKYAITLDDGAVTNVFGVKSKRYHQNFQIDNEDNYSNLALKVTVPDTSKQYIVEFYQTNKNILKRTIITKNTTIVYNNYISGKYYIRVIYDDNRNGKWDTGNVKLKIYPENIWIDPVSITLRPNFDEEMPITIPREEIAP